MPDSPCPTTADGPEHREMSVEKYERFEDRVRHGEQFLGEALKAIREAREVLEEEE